MTASSPSSSLSSSSSSAGNGCAASTSVICASVVTTHLPFYVRPSPSLPTHPLANDFLLPAPQRTSCSAFPPHLASTHSPMLLQMLEIRIDGGSSIRLQRRVQLFAVDEF